jgi:hypothetical protein
MAAFLTVFFIRRAQRDQVYMLGIIGDEGALQKYL